MARDLTAGMITALTAEVVEPVMMVDLLFDTPNELYYWTGVGDLDFNGNTYEGVGQLLTITDIQETALLKAAGITLQLNGVYSDIISLALDEDYSERIATVYFGAFDSTKTLISTSFQAFSGRMDVMTIESDGQVAVITLTVENRLVDLERPKVRRYTSEDQKAEFSGDLGLDFVVSLNDGKELVWGR